tara:strand:+ start:19643 stop:20176 length:534 start_codon:yes stop_codon:yes gene_type:complete
MAGGIQKGMVATDEAARTLDKHCKNAAKVFNEHLVPKHGGRLVAVKAMPKDKIPGGTGACQPDGWLWFFDGVLIAAFEAKKQQDKGNAIERWYKNNFICRTVNPDVSYVTFAVGEGAYEAGQIGKILSPAHTGSSGAFNAYVPGRNSCFMSRVGFSAAEVQAIMLQVINERIESLSQ